MTNRRAAALGLLLFVAAMATRPVAAPDGGHADVPLAAALAPLGPVKAVVSALLWHDLLRRQIRGGESEAVASLGTALLELHPDLDVVREYLAEQLIVNEAGRAPDRRRHQLMVARGLKLLEDGLDGRDNPRLSGSLGRLLYWRTQIDPWFPAAVEQYWGDTPEELAIDTLRRATDSPTDMVLLADLLVERGLRTVRAGGDAPGARRDLDEARALLQSVEVEPEAIEDALGPLQRSLDRNQDGSGDRP